MKITFLFKALVIFLMAGVFSSANEKIFQKHHASMSDEEYDFFILGKSFFRIPWVEAPSATTARDGLGPLFNANTCSSCHPRNGRGFGRRADGQLDRSVIIKLARQVRDSASYKEILFKNGVIGDEIYGGQLQISGTFGVPYEALPTLYMKNFYTTYPDGKVVKLEKPIIKLNDFQYGNFGKDTVLSMRFAQPLVGMGLIDRIESKDILEWEDIEDKDKNGISGKANYVYSRELGEKVLGRFNWKASTPSLKEQIALAFHDDMGLSNHLYPTLPCTKHQKECLSAPKPRDELDLPPLRLEAVNFYVSALALPRQKITNKKGEVLFHSIGCANCHRPSYTLSDKSTITPYSDFLLHDMGNELADKREDFQASGNEWRTQPLWGLRYAKEVLKQEPRYLHDARAKSLEEAILWHGGEALRAKLAFMALQANHRKSLIKFLKEL